MSYEDFDEKIKNEIIVLSHFPQENRNSYFSLGYEYISSWEKIREKEKIEKEKTKEEIKKEVEKEIFQEKEKLKEQSLKSFYKIDETKNQELEKYFKISKLKVNLCNIQFLGNGQICGKVDNKYIIYDDKYFNKLYEIQFESKDNIESIIQLDNKDLIIFSKKRKNDNSWNYDYELLIYRLKDKNYSLFQTIKEDRKGYKLQNSYSGCMVYSKSFSLMWIKKLSGNRFMSISNYGIKIYSLNEKSQYSLVLLEPHLEGIEKIYEINENKFIFCTRKNYGASLGGPAHDYLLIEKIDIRNLNKEELNKKINESKEKERDFYDFDESEEINEEESQAIISSLKLTYSSLTLFKYCTYGGRHNFSNFVILKNKYFTILVDNELLLFNLLNDTFIERFTFLKDGVKNLYINKYFDIRKWNKANDNEFLLIDDGNITLIELNENNLNKESIINLKIIGHYSFQDNSSLLCNEDNRFYVQKKDNILLY